VIEDLRSRNDRLSNRHYRFISWRESGRTLATDSDGLGIERPANLLQAAGYGGLSKIMRGIFC
jgi:hypothetical protein